MKLLIADDEELARARLRALLAFSHDAGLDIDIVGEVGDGDAVVAFCDARPVDVVLLDIGMPGRNGIDAALVLARQSAPPAVIFTTACSEHALAAFDANAIDYLLKPIRATRLHKALHKAARLSAAQQDALRDEVPALVVSHREGVRRIPLAEVHYLQADNKYVRVGHLGGEDLIEDSLVSIEQRFPGRFERIHRNALVDPVQVVALEKDADGRAMVRLRDDTIRLEVSRRHLPIVRRWLKSQGPT